MAQSSAQRVDDTEPPPAATGNRPFDKVRLGQITANIWRNSGQNGDYFSVSFERSYKDEQGQLQSTSSFRPADLPVVETVSQKAVDRIMEIEKGRGR